MAASESAFGDLAYFESHQSTTSPLSPPTSRPKTTAKLAQQVQPSSSTSSNDIHDAPKPSSGVYDEQNFDLFSTLFSPSTPRPSPDMASGPLPVEEARSKPPPPHLHHRSVSMSSQSSDFGAFVSVSTFDDPLTAQFRDFDDMLQEPIIATTTNAPNSAVTSSNSFSVEGTGLDIPRRPASRNSSSSSRSASRSLHNNNVSERPPNSNPTLNFFDQFAQEAKERSSNRSSLLDELLLHQDDPLYFLKDKSLPSTPSTATTAAPSSPPPPIPLAKSPLIAGNRTIVSPTSISPSPPHPQSMLASSSTDSTITLSTSNGTPKPSLDDLNHEFDLTHDVDHHYFRVLPSNTSHPSKSPSLSTLRLTPYSSPGPLATQSTPHHDGRPPLPVRSPSIAVAEPKIAEPVTSIGLASGSPSMAASASIPPIAFQYQKSASLDNSEHEQHRVDKGQEGLEREQEQEREHKLMRTPSHPSLSDSLTAISSKWMSTFLRGAGSPGPSPSPAHGGGAKPALESIFNDPHTHSELPHHAQTLPLPTTSPHQHFHSASPSRAQKPVEPTFTHSSAFSPPPSSSSSVLSGLPALSGTSSSFASSMTSTYSTYPSSYSTSTLTHTTSPFGPHIYTPPSGAPGYAGEGYGARGWDKGYSEELEREMLGSTISNVAADGKVENDQAVAQRRPTQSKTLPVPGYGERVEKGRDDADGRAGRGRGGWGSGFSFPFGSIRGRGGSTNTAIPSTQTATKMNTEAEQHGNSNGGAKHGPTSQNGSDDPHGSLGAFIEKKSGNVELLGRKEMTTPVLTPELAAKLRSYLPALARLPKSWSLIYSLDQNGISLNTLYSRCETHTTRRPIPGEVLNTSMLFAMKDADGAVFGAWLAEGVRGVKSNRGYFGGGESFLWKYENDTLKIFKCTGKNNYVAFCESEYISFGGGDGHYGLYLDDTLFDGSSAPCPTFNNEPLCSPGPKKGSTVTFECVGLEVWGMGP